jgi:glucosamine--fructose-6-phosphate aminotransferase (isomerizing)
VKELAYISTDGYSEADFRHGPIAVIQPGFPILLVAPKGKVFWHLSDLFNQLNERKAECLVISNDDTAFTGAYQQIRIPAIPEWLSPIVAVIPGQVFAMQQALIRGYEVDKPRGLRKVTVTI